MKFSIEGPDRGVLLSALASLPAFRDTPTLVEVDRVERPPSDDWIARWLPTVRRNLMAEWGDEHVLWSLDGCILAISPTLADDLPGLARFLADLPFELAVLWTPHHAHWKAADYRPTSFSDGHLAHGWACMFKGAGHDRLVSHRWLDQGPWRLTRLPGDVSLVEFYDLQADPETAFAQAKAGHDRMGISARGGFLQSTVGYYNELDGIYDPGTRTYKVPVAVRALKPSEMLDACTLRADKRNDPDTPIEQAGFVFVMGPEEAEPYLHELWTRELGCWGIVDGHDVRLDTDYTPPRHTTPW